VMQCVSTTLLSSMTSCVFVLQCVAVSCSMLQCVSTMLVTSMMSCVFVLQYVAMR